MKKLFYNLKIKLINIDKLVRRCFIIYTFLVNFYLSLRLENISVVMIVKKEKRKRKRSLEKIKGKLSNDEDKYLAYKQKIPMKDSKKIENESDLSTFVIDDMKEKSNKRMKKKKSTDINNIQEVSKIIPTDFAIEDYKLISAKHNHKKNVTISAKPKLKKNVITSLELKFDKNANSKFNDAKNTITKDIASKCHLTKPYEDFEDLPDAEIIEPTVSFTPKMKEVDFLEDLMLTEANIIESKETYGFCTAPMVVEANLKMSTDYYIPDFLKNDIVKIGYNVLKKKPSTKNLRKKHKLIMNTTNYLEEKSDQKLNKIEKNSLVNKTKSKNESNCTSTTRGIIVENICNNNERESSMSKDLQEFYDEITRGSESFANKLSNRSKNNDKKSTLTIDKSVKDQKNLVNIVETNINLSTKSTLNQTKDALFFSLESKVILVLRPDTQFSFLGKLKMNVLYGAVEVYGYIFDFQNTLIPVEVYSPRGYSSISFKTHNSNDSNDKETLWDALTGEGVDRSLKTNLHDAIQECQPGWSVLLLENFENTLTTFLNSYYTFKLFPKIESVKYPWYDPRRAECILQANFQFHHQSDEGISITPQWNESVIKHLLSQWKSTKSLCTIITGGKSVGKSTAARYIINNFLKYSDKVVLIDLDPGQAEMTPAGCVSLNIIDEPLLGPNFTHLKIPFYQLYLEDVNITNCISRYVECCKKVVECLRNRKDILQYPVIVNTMGFCKGIGLDICTFLIKLIKPNNVIQILSKRPKNNFDFALLKHNINNKKTSSIFLEENNLILEEICDYKLHSVNSVAEGRRQFDTWNIEPRQQRELVLQSYLSQIIKNAKNDSFCNFNSNRINNVKPFRLPFSSFYVALLDSNIPPTHILAAMNGNIVALCGIDMKNETLKTNKISTTYPMVIIKPPTCTCYGYGIVRGIDMKNCCIYINTPLGASELRHTNLLLGCSPVPFSLLHSGERQPYSGDRSKLPTSRESKRGYFRVDQNRDVTK